MSTPSTGAFDFSTRASGLSSETKQKLLPRLQLVAQYLFKRTNSQFILKTSDVEVMSDILMQMLAYSSSLFWEQIMKPMQNEKQPIYLMIAVRTGKAMLDSPAGIFWNTNGSSSVSVSGNSQSQISQSNQREMLNRAEIERVVLASFKHIFQYASEQAGISVGLSQVGYFPSSIAFGTYFEQFPLLSSSNGSNSGNFCFCFFFIVKMNGRN